MAKAEGIVDCQTVRCVTGSKWVTRGAAKCPAVQRAVKNEPFHNIVVP